MEMHDPDIALIEEHILRTYNAPNTKFAITDFIYVRQFETEINIIIDRKV